MANEEVGNTVTEEFSLADLANLDTSEIAVVKSRLPMAGLWTVLCISATLTVSKPTEAGQQPLPRVAHKFESVKIEPTEIPEDFDPATTAGRKIQDQTTFWPADFAENVGLLKGKYARVGADVSGVLGGTEEVKGWLNNVEGMMLTLKVRHAEIKGETRAFIDWVGPAEDQGEAA